MHIVTVNKTEYALGLKWARLTPDKVRSEVKQLSKQWSHPYGVVQSEGDRNFTGLTDDKNAKGKYSAAACLAKVFPNLIYTTKLEGGSYWVVAIIEGEVLPSSDSLLKDAEVIEKITEFASIPSSEDVTMLASKDAVESLNLDVEEVVELEDLFSDLSTTKSEKIDSLGSFDSSIKVGLAVTAAVGVLFFGYSQYTGYQEAKRVEEINAQLANQRDVRAEQAAEAERRKQEMLAKALLEEKQSLGWALEYATTDAVLNRFSSALNLVGAPIKGGWTLDQLNLSSFEINQEKPSTIYFFENNAQATFNDLVSAFPQAFERGQLEADKEGIKLSLSMVGPEIEALGDRELSDSELNEKFITPSTESPRNRLYNHFLTKSDITFSVAVKPKLEFYRKTPIPGIADPDLAKQRRVPVRTYEVSIEGSDLHRLYDVLGTIDENLKQQLLWEEMAYSPVGASWKIKGFYYEKK